ncbi:MAG TPA: hypothetical protein VEQ65_10110, partial [Opitutus sp.]|nr:hypothetical protein [Opitutus sp.]
GSFAPDRPGANPADERAESLRTFRWNMDMLVQQLVAAAEPRPTLVLVTPTAYDETAQLTATNLVGLNHALGEASRLLTRVARKHRAHLVDLHTPTTELNRMGQAVDATFSLSAPDRMHPNSVGHLAAAYHYLKAQGVGGGISSFAIDGTTGEIKQADRGRILNLDARPGELAFDCEEHALPWPIAPDAAPALAWLPGLAELNQQKLAIHFADAGRYAFTIDGERVGEFTAAELRAGIDLARLRTPQARQAQQLLAALEQRRVANFAFRRVAQVRTMLQSAKIDARDTAAVEAYFAKRLPERPDYFQALFADYRATLPRLAALREEFEASAEALRQLNRPTPHRYRFERM